MRTIRTSITILVLSGIIGLNAVPVGAGTALVRMNNPITDFDPSDDIHEDSSRL